ncbi:Putative 28S ribosomal protein S25 [Septoria linicola]|uniref:28S ribosomal protein S25 n=1 Tax=Septoria linicola TaxID=215465 RepID=A0A9Q9AEP5_9PEZI|nr:Putative 28S ribosomal protein S25 [Septoria linicola]
MVSLPQRMRKLQNRLLAIRLGPGALVLPRDVKRISLRFAPKMNEGHMGPRKFWRHELVRLKYHNPSVPMTVDRTAQQDEPAVLTIHLQPEDAETEKVETVNMKNYRSSEILDALIQLTKARQVDPTPEDQEQIAKLEDQRQRSQRDSKLSQEVRARVKREKELLEQARGDLAAQNS